MVMADPTNEDEFFRDLAVNFLRDMLVQTETLDSKISQRAKEEIAVFGHTLKGSGAMFGFPEISALGLRLEDAARAEQWDNARETSAAIRKAIERDLR